GPAALFGAHVPDSLCLPQCDATARPDVIGGLSLAQGTSGNRLGLAMYLRDNQYRVEQTRTIGLKKALPDRVLRPAHERVLGARPRNNDPGHGMHVAPLHQAPLTALNSRRRNQIRAGLDALQELGADLPVLMVGDYNYPVFKESLGQTVREHGYRLTLSDDRTYTRYRVFRGHYDFATSSGFDISHI